jgi:hypothetical protein
LQFLNKGEEYMKKTDCPGYNKNTEIERYEVGTAGGKRIYKETEIILSEHCSLLNKVDDFDCTNCPFAIQKAKKQNNV